MKNINWTIKHFIDLTPLEIYNMFFLRQKIFVVEQDCAYQDVDEKDKYSHHLFGFVGDSLSAYLRILPPNTSYNEVSIGRVLVSEENRHLGIGKKLMKKGIEDASKIFKTNSIRLSAQTYLVKFYESLGFKKVGEIYLEDNIPHIEMFLEY
jgi:ElaA protein